MPIALHIISGHIGDLQYYTSNYDYSWRTLLSTSNYRILFQLTGNYTILILVWSIILFILCKITISRLSLIGKILLLVNSPFLFFPSKESTIFVLFLLARFLIRNFRMPRTLSLIAFLSIIRPMLIPLLFSNTMQRIAFILLICGAVSTLFIADIITSIITSIEIAKAYSYGYFITAENAGSTDYEFLHSIPDTDAFEYLKSIMVRILFPIWMLNLGLTGKMYFLIYCLNLVYTLTSVLKSFSTGAGAVTVAVSLIFFTMSLAMFAPLCVVNAGSAVRYLSIIILPALMHSWTRDLDFRWTLVKKC